MILMAASSDVSLLRAWGKKAYFIVTVTARDSDGSNQDRDVSKSVFPLISCKDFSHVVVMKSDIQLYHFNAFIYLMCICHSLVQVCSSC